MARRMTRRSFLKGVGSLGAGLALAPALLAEDKKATAADKETFYFFENRTKGKFSDEQIGWSLGGDKSFKSLAEAKGAPARLGGGGRLYIRMTDKNGDKYTDFIEFTHGASGWYGNTTQVDEFVIPLTIELFDADGKSEKVGITESRSALFEAFKKDAPKEFQACVKGTQRIVSPCRAGFNKGQANGNYFDKYIDDVWSSYATEKTENGWKKSVLDGALTFTGPAGKTFRLPKKPSTQDALLGTGVLGGLPMFCAAINRHVLGEPENWDNPAKYYPALPANYYAKFWHEHSINHKAYGFCYDDWAKQDTLLHYTKPTKLVITLYWD